MKDVNIDFPGNSVTALMGPSGCGKSTLLRTINRLNDLVPGSRIEGKVLLEEVEIYGRAMDVVDLRRRVGMVFQRPNPFPKSIRDNILFGLQLDSSRGDSEIHRMRVEDSLVQAGLWEEVSERLDDPALDLSGGQQQRLCIARAIAVKPDIILMDEPCSALDPVSTRTIEALIGKLKERYTIIVVTHNMQQAERISDFTAVMYLG
ncbi:phosphate ABC transporter ATP-binding protein [Akkermansiaceae bacterium]|nr:phosphate ABC transporter ATP-binding protein [Akkermansiaceae bacterium]